ncbi:MAG: 7TM diverse intracellular signaling domain-containing protein, partial [Inhella sp.]
MPGISGQPAQPLANPENGLDRLIYRLVAYVLPATFLLLTLHALLNWQAVDTVPAEVPMVFRVADDVRAAWSPADAMRELEHAAAQLSASAQLATHPIWIRVDLPEADRSPDWLEFPSRHATRLDCWRGDKAVGRADRARTQGAMQPARGGFALALDAADAGQALVCRAQFSGPARISVLARSHQELHLAEERFSRESGWLDGGLIMLALFLFITAMINRNGAYVLFAAWMLLNLRMAALSTGADVQWLGQRVPEDWLHPMRMLTIALYYASTYALFRNFFREELERVGHGPMLRLAGLSCAALLVGSLMLPYARFLPVVWACAALNIGVLLYYLGRILWLTRSQVAMWYAGSIAITLFAGLAEVVAAALSLRITDVVNSTTAA